MLRGERPCAVDSRQASKVAHAASTEARRMLMGEDVYVGRNKRRQKPEEGCSVHKCHFRKKGMAYSTFFAYIWNYKSMKVTNCSVEPKNLVFVRS